MGLIHINPTTTKAATMITVCFTVVQHSHYLFSTVFCLLSDAAMPQWISTYAMVYGGWPSIYSSLYFHRDIMGYL